MDKNKLDKAKALETLLVLVGALVIFFWVTQKKIFLLLALLLILIAIVSESLSMLIAKGWLKLGSLMGMVMSKVILTVVYFIVLFPVAMLYKLTGKDNLALKRKESSYYSIRNHVYSKKDMDNIW